MLLGVGYAALTDTLTIIGNANIDIATANKTFDEKIYFSAAQVLTSEGTGTGDKTADNASFDPDDATFTVHSLAIVGEKAVFKFTVKNDSNVDAIISVNATKTSGAVNPSNSNADKFDVTYKYENGNLVSQNNGQIAKQGGTIDIYVTVTVKEPVTSALTATFGIELTVTSVEDIPDDQA